MFNEANFRRVSLVLSGIYSHQTDPTKMSKRECIARYALIIRKLRKHPSTFQEIAETLELESRLQDDHFLVSKRTFQRDLDDIRLLYNVDIQYNFSRKVYYINVEDQPDVHDRILEAFDTFNALNLFDRLSDHIHFEKRRPAGTEHLHGFLHAIKNRLVIKFTYSKFWDDVSTQRIVEPYALKEFKNRWYVLAKEENGNAIKSFGLDRLTDLVITKKTFIYPVDYNIEESYRHCFGIISPTTEQPEEIILSFTAFQGKYIKTLSLHHTQKILIDNDEELRISLKLYVTHDLIMELLSYGKNLKVIQPQTLVDKIKKEHKKAFERYK